MRKANPNSYANAVGVAIGTKRRKKRVMSPAQKAAFEKNRFKPKNSKVTSSPEETGETIPDTESGPGESKPSRKGTKKMKGPHPGFQNVAADIAAKQGVTQDQAAAMLAASTRRASPAAKRANPSLKRVK